jgi:tetratricopeptide (TPR) repeat protein
MMVALLTLSVLGQQYTASEIQAIFAEANALSSQKSYEAADEKYQRLVNAKWASADLWYNLGTNALAAKKLGRAVLFLERAAQVDDNEDVESNLSYAASLQVDNVIGEETSAEVFGERLVKALPLQLPGIALLCCAWAALACWLVFRLFLVESAWLRVTFALLCVGCVVSAVVTGLQVNVLGQRAEAVIQADVVKVLDSSAAGANSTFEVHAGLKVKVVGRAEGLVRIRLPNALEGWVPEASLEMI